MSETPRTDAELSKPENRGRVTVSPLDELCRELEHELADITSERDRLRQTVDVLREWGGRCQDEMQKQARRANDWKRKFEELERENYNAGVERSLMD